MGKITPISTIEAYIDNAIQEWNIPGSAVAIFNHGEVISSRGYGVRKVGTSDLVDENTLFPIGSCTKAFTAGIIGTLVDEGKLQWDDPIVKFLPEFRMYDPWVTTHVTLRDMLSHRIAVMRSIRLMYRDRKFNPDDYISRMAFLRPVGDFRAKFSYNNPGFIVAGKVAEVVSGQRWKTLIEERFFSPLGMTSSTASYQDMVAQGSKNIANPHANLDESFVPAELRVLDPVKAIPWTDLGDNAAGSINSNLKDMAAWLAMLLQGGKFHESTIISTENLAEMTSPQMVIKPNESEMDALYAVGLESNLMTYGLGWYVTDYRGHKMVFHPGQVNGFVAAVAYLPQLQIGGVILMNTYQTMLHAMLGYYIFDSLLGFDRDYSHEMKTLVNQWRAGAEMQIEGMLSGHPEPVAPSIPNEKMVGTFESPLFGNVNISLEDGHLIYQYGETEVFDADLQQWQDLTYVVNYRNKINPLEFLTFIPDENGNIMDLAIKDVDMFHRI